MPLSRAGSPLPLRRSLNVRFGLLILLSFLAFAGTFTVAVRMPDHAAALRLVEPVGRPLAAASANLSGHPHPRTASAGVAPGGGDGGH